MIFYIFLVKCRICDRLEHFSSAVIFFRLDRKDSGGSKGDWRNGGSDGFNRSRLEGMRFVPKDNFFLRREGDAAGALPRNMPMVPAAASRESCPKWA